MHSHKNLRGATSRTPSTTGATLRTLATLLLVVVRATGRATDEPERVGTLCSRLIPHFDTPCLCSSGSADAAGPGSNSSSTITMNCDGVTIRKDFPSIPPRLPLEEYTHRDAGLRTLDGDLFAARHLPLLRVDFSGNHVQRLPEQLFAGVRDTLQEVRLGRNRLGHQLNPIFATEEFATLARLRLLDLGGNALQALEDGVFRGLGALRILHLDGNLLDVLPLASLQNLVVLRELSFQHNRLERLKTANLASLAALESLNLSSNVIVEIDDGAFTGLANLTTLDVSNNKLRNLNNPNSFVGLTSLQRLHLDQNFLQEVPSHTLRPVTTLTHLTLSSNGIREIRLDDFAQLSTLTHLDLSRNRIAELPPAVFQQLTSLRTLLLDTNLIHKMEARMFDGLQALERLSIDDNNVLVLPELDVLPALTGLVISYNRIAAVSSEMMQPLSSLQELMLDFNLVREIPAGTFHNFSDLRRLSLRGNVLGAVTATTFEGLERTVRALDLGANGLDTFPTFPAMAQLQTLDLSDNRITVLPDDALAGLATLARLDLRSNRLAEWQPNSFRDHHALTDLDLSDNQLHAVVPGILAPMAQLRTLDLSGNSVGEIEEGTFHDLVQLEELDLSTNRISIVRHNALRNVHALRRLNVSGNLLTVLDGQIFGSRLPELRELDLSRNHIHYIIPNALTAVANLRALDLGHNKLTIFLEGTLQGADYLERLSLVGNQLQHLDNGQFSHAARLRFLDCSGNQIEAVGEGAFTNSSQLRFLNLSSNALAVLPDAVFAGIARLSLDLSHNNFSSLPTELFARGHVANLESVNLASNQFTLLPLSGLNEQYAALETLRVENNRITHVPANANSLVNVKYLDVSGNPLSRESIQNIFGEPKTVQVLRASNCGITELDSLETPFLQLLNLSGNSLTSLAPALFRRATMLTTLILADNRLDSGVAALWPQVPKLTTLDVSGNPLRDIGPAGLSSLTRLETLDLSRLAELGRFDHETFRGMTNLKHLSIHGYPRLGFYDVRGILESTPALESLQVEVKGTVLRDQLHPALNSRLRLLTIFGDTLQNLTSVSLAGLLAPAVRVGIHGTAIATIPHTLFLPLPASMDIELDVSGNRVSLLGPQLLATLNKKRSHVELAGLAANPLHCDCFMKPMLKWIRDRIADGRQATELRRATCSGGPAELQDRPIWQLTEEELLCERQRTTTEATPTTTTAPPVEVAPPRVAAAATTTTAEPEPDIIYEAPTTKNTDGPGTQIAGTLTNIDSMIIVIIVGVVAFVCILIIIICIIKLRHSRVRHYHGGPVAMSPVDGGAGCTCVKQPPGNGNGSANGSLTLCHCHPNFPPHAPHNGPLPPKLLALHCESRNSSLPRSIMHGQQPYHGSYTESNADYR